MEIQITNMSQRDFNTWGLRMWKLGDFGDSEWMMGLRGTWMFWMVLKLIWRVFVKKNRFFDGFWVKFEEILKIFYN